MAGESIREQLLEALVDLYGGPDVMVRAPASSYIDEVKVSGFYMSLEEQDEELTQDNEYGRKDFILPVVVARVEHLPELAGIDNFRQVALARSTRANAMLAELRRLPRRNRDLGGTCKRLQDIGGGTIYPDQAHDVVGAFVRLNCVYETALFNPDVR